jgi:hypothetical protein
MTHTGFVLLMSKKEDVHRFHPAHVKKEDAHRFHPAHVNLSSQKKIASSFRPVRSQVSS